MHIDFMSSERCSVGVEMERLLKSADGLQVAAVMLAEQAQRVQLQRLAPVQLARRQL